MSLNPGFNSYNELLLSLLDKVTTGTQIFVPVIAKVVILFPSEIAQFVDQVRVRLILQLIKGISRVIQKLLKYFNGTAISTFTISSLLVLFKNFDLNLND